MLNNETSETIYAEHTEDPRSWSSPRPSFDVEKFNREIELRGGLIGSVPHFRVKWAPDDDAYLLDENAFLVGYTFIEDGKERFVSCAQRDFEFPDEAVVLPRYEYQKCFIPRWVIEQFVDGSYTAAWYIEEIELVSQQAGHKILMSRYCEPSEVDLQIAAGTRYMGATLTAEDITKGLATRNARRIKDYTDKKEEIRQDNHHWANKYAKDGVPSPVFSIPLKPEIKNISKEQIAKV